ncbi:GDNF family receptor alpha-like [Octodon degus]|uniref:GDNF family receptor alpha-like n=1 Tax=Octodon degus TaxID=10160 RepID=A0A6P3VDZ0_OCTDE|nr:GDNF family receptor alpha-like [Octodon degus]
MGLSSENKSTSLTKDCAYLRQQCLSGRTTCGRAWRVVEDACNVSDPGDSCKITNSSHCNLTIQFLMESSFQFKQCVCTDDLYCTVNTLFGIKCINKSDHIKEDKTFTWNLIAPSHHGLQGMPSCLEVTEACVGDVVCNVHLAPYLKACSATGNLCDPDHCQTATRSFYQSAPFNVAQMLAFCDCAPSDALCQQSRDALHSKPCTRRTGPAPTCLSTVHSCRDDELCRRRYRTFQSKCWPHVAAKCQDDDRCIRTLGRRDLACSGTEACRAAYLGVLGTELQGGCTCGAAAPNEESLCEIFQQLLHRQSCFNYPILSKAEGVPLYRGKHAKDIALSGLHPAIDGEVIYAVMCMTVTCGVLVLVMLKLRLSRISRCADALLQNGCSENGACVDPKRRLVAPKATEERPLGGGSRTEPGLAGHCVGAGGRPTGALNRRVLRRHAG